MTTAQSAPFPAEPLGIFGHHPDKSIDFCCEVDMLEGWLVEVNVGLQSQWPFWGRLSRALRFAGRETDLDDWAIRAIPTLRGMEAKAHPPGNLTGATRPHSESRP